MFSHLCRACTVELDQLDPSQTVPLFEKYQDVFLNQVCNAMNLSMDEKDNLGENVCIKCAETILKFYTFHLMFTKSNRKLRKMLLHSIDSKTLSIQNKNDDDPNVSHVASVVQTSLGISDSEQKCKKCSACFRSRLLLRRHVNQVHKNNRDNSLANTVRSTNSENGNPQHRWTCSYCMSCFRTRGLKNSHQKECRRLNASAGSTEITEVKESEFIDYNNFDTSEFHSGSEANNENDFDDDYSLSQRESKYKVDLSGISDQSNVADGKWKCKKCSQCFGSLELLHLHESEQHSEPPDNKCFSHVNIKQEQVDFEYLPDLKTENYSHEYDNATAGFIAQQATHFRWKCKTCLHAFETRELLRTHRRIHTGQRKLAQTMRTGWNCNICNAILPSRDKVRLHKNIDHPNEKRGRRSHNETKNWGDVGQYDCELCNKTYISKSKIRKHMDVHKNKNRPKRLCTVCGLELCSTYNLNNHIRTVHGRERKFHCTLCDRKFSHSHHLKTHMNRHDGIRPFQCDQCVKSFFDKTTLREHIKSVHLNVKAYECKICSRTFNRSGNMRAHMLKTHNLGDIGGVNRSFGIGTSNDNPSVDESDEFTHQRLFPNSLGEPLRVMIMKTSN